MKKPNKKRFLKETDNFYRFVTKDSTKKIHILNIDFIVKTIDLLLTISCLKRIGYKNALNLTKRKLKLKFSSLPENFNNYKILFLSDLHLDIIPEMQEKLIDLIKTVQFDLCLIGGDFRFYNIGNSIIAQEIIQNIVFEIKKKSDIISIIGNHDEYEFAEFLNSIGIEVLINDSVEVYKGNGKIVVCGIDDAGYYGAHDFQECLKGVNKKDFKILLSHTPDVYKEAEKLGFDLFLAGHTHGGQLCLPGGIPVITETNAPRQMAYGKWNCRKMQGYTTSGVGCSGIPARFFCPPEIVIIELIKC